MIDVALWLRAKAIVKSWIFGAKARTRLLKPDLKRWPLQWTHLSDKPSLSFQDGRASDRTQKSGTFASDALSKADEVFCQLFEEAPDAQWLHRVDAHGSLSTEACNRRARAMIGGDFDAIADAAPWAIWPETVSDRIRGDIQRTAETGEVQRREDTAVLSNGLAWSWEAVHIPLRDTAGAVTRVISSFHDIGASKAAEAAACEANRLLRMAEGIAHVGHWRLDHPSGALFWSEEIYRIHGLNEDTFKPTLTAAIEAYHPDDRSLVSNQVEQALFVKGFVDFTARIVRPEGDTRSVLVRGFCQRGPSEGGQSLFGVIMDVTDLRRAEARLRENAALLKATLDNMDQGLIMADPSGRVPICNKRALDLLDLPAVLMASHPHSSEVRAYQQRHGEFDREVEPGGSPFDPLMKDPGFSICERMRPNGTILEIRTVGLPVGGVVQTFTDVTAQRRAEQALRAAEARYRLLADNTSDLIILGHADGRRSYISPAVKAMLGYTIEEAYQLKLRALLHSEDVAKVFETTKALSIDKPEATVIFRMRRKDGHHIWVEAALRRVEDGNDGVVTIVIAVRDVTERQERTDELRMARDTAEAARTSAENASRAKTEFLASMSHEIRTPLNAIIGFTDLMAGSGRLEPDLQRYAELVRTSGSALLTLVNDILDFSQVEAGSIEFVNKPFLVTDLVDNCISIVSGGAEAKSLRIESWLAPAVPHALSGDEARLRQILLNLLNNAVKFTRQGSVTLAVHHDGSDETGESLRFSITDTGMGIPRDKQHRLFQRFSQVDGSIRRDFGGTGLGLAICKQLVDRMGGEIGVVSESGQGATFWFTIVLPRGPAEPLRDAPAIVQHRAARNRGRLLLAEDVGINQELARLVLEAAGHTVEIVNDGAAAVEAIQRNGAYDLVLMDVQMPGMDGITATHRIRELAPPLDRIPIIAMTANVLPDEIKRFHKAGMDDHIGKPFDRDELYAVIDRWMPIQTSAEAAGPVACDCAVRDQLVALLGPDVVRDLLSEFDRELRTRLRETPLSDSDGRGRMRRDAHAIVPAAGMLGFMDLAKACSDLHAFDETMVARDGQSGFRLLVDRACQFRERVLRQRDHEDATGLPSGITQAPIHAHA